MSSLRRAVRPVVILVALIVSVELGCAAGIALYRQSRLSEPATDTLKEFMLTAWASRWFEDTAAETERAARVAPYLAGRRYLGVLRKNSAEWREFFPVDPLLGFRSATNVVAIIRDSVYVTNGQGFVSTGTASFTFQPLKPRGVFRVIVVGGSTVLGQGAKTPAENLPARLRQRLERRYPRVEVINAGVGGYFSGQELLRVAAELLPYSPDLIVVYDGWNDQYFLDALFRQLPHAAANSLKSPTHYELETRLARSYTVGGSLRTFLGVLKANVVLGLGRLASFSLLGSAATGAVEAIAPTRPVAAPPSSAQESSRSVQIYVRNVRSLIGMAVQNGVKIAVLLQPIMGVDGKSLTPEEAAYERAMIDGEARRRFYREARALFDGTRLDQARATVCLADLSRTLAQTSETVYADSGHLNVRGNDLVAEAIERALDRCHLLSARP
jgi:hypothetical protein